MKNKYSHAHSCCCGGGISDGEMKVSTKLILSAISLLASIVISFFHIDFPFFPYSDPAWIAVYFCSGNIFESALHSLIVQKKISVSMLVSVAMIASFALQIMGALGYDVGEHSHSYIFVVGEIAFLKALAEWLESKTTNKTRDGIKALTKLMPKTAKIKIENGIKEILAQSIKCGDIVCINPHEMISADGIVIKGSSAINQANITGESVPVDVSIGDKVLCGTFNESSYLEVKALKSGDDSVLAKMIELIEEAEGKKAPIARIAAKWATYIVPSAISIAIIVFFVAYFALATSLPEAIVRATTILVVFCPCAFVLATPTAISAGIGNASKNGILIKSGETLEAFSKISTVFFDKTGTLTDGKIRLERIEQLSDSDESQIIAKVAALEKQSLHPIAKAILEYAVAQNINIPEAENIIDTTGYGVKGLVNNAIIEIKKSSLKNAYTASDVFENGKLLARLYFADNIRSSSKSAVLDLNKMGIRTAILSGDNNFSVNKISVECAIDSSFADLLPKDKLDKIQQAKERGEFVCMIGDGVNDAPSLAAADISVAIADLKNDIAISTADISLLKGDLNKIPSLVRFSKQVISTIGINIIFSLTISITSVVLGAMGIITPAIGALIHNFSSISVVANSARLINSKTLSDK